MTENRPNGSASCTCSDTVCLVLLSAWWRGIITMYIAISTTAARQMHTRSMSTSPGKFSLQASLLAIGLRIAASCAAAAVPIGGAANDRL
ncbi:hypothetical protein K431DRAFT_54012 [Polychaeton citri CBS 116435]|uniref:Uncharacterized protein n=1 Tax=Polychaeton citri CBS 116435 TaxID=1314669 RepID=A0A9P4QJ52_9PEZI|nr:hypothetical protein K431DRAFT_54012 [Polychaeton citri CBS 116435]